MLEMRRANAMILKGRRLGFDTVIHHAVAEIDEPLKSDHACFPREGGACAGELEDKVEWDADWGQARHGGEISEALVWRNFRSFGS